MMANNWRELSDDEQKQIGELPEMKEIKNINELQAEIYTLSRPGTVRHAEDGELTLEAGEKVKVLNDTHLELLEATNQADLCYEVVSLWVFFGGKREFELKTGLTVSVLPQDYKKLLEEDDGPDEANH